MNMEDIERLRQQAIENTEGKEFDPSQVVIKFIDADGNEQVVHDSRELRSLIERKHRRDKNVISVARVGNNISVGHVIPGDAIPKTGVTRIERAGYYLRGGERNKPCPCGSGLKAKRCPCDKYEV